MYKKVIKGCEICGMNIVDYTKILFRKISLLYEMRSTVEKVNVDFDVSRKEFWAFVGRTKVYFF